MGRYRYPLGLQMLLPDDYPTRAEFARSLETLRRLGFDGVELNIRDPEAVDPGRLKAHLAGFGLVLSMFASGLTAKTSRLSLATDEEARRAESVRRTVGFLEFAREFGAGVIAGYLKGSPEDAKPGNRDRLRASVAEIGPVADRLRVPFLLEAVNRYESPYGHSLADTWDLAREARTPFVQILPDTFHMNIEEANMAEALTLHQGCFTSLHLSDNTRRFPGFGAIDFGRVLAILDGIGYPGKLAIEGNLGRGLVEDVEAAMRYLGPLLTHPSGR